MGINAQLEDEDGEPIQFCEDVLNSFVHLLSTNDLAGSICLRFIDPYGDTIFNRVQAAVLVEELKAIRATADSNTAVYIDNVLRLANVATGSS